MFDKEREFKSAWRREIAGRLLAISFVLFLGVVSLLSGQALDRIAGAAIIALALGTAYQTWRHRPAAPTDPSDSTQATLRRQLERQRNSLRSSWLWYVAPFLLALLLFALRMAPVNLPKAAPFGILAVGWAIAMVYLSLRAAKDLQRQIDDLDSGKQI